MHARKPSNDNEHASVSSERRNHQPLLTLPTKLQVDHSPSAGDVKVNEGSISKYRAASTCKHCRMTCRLP